MEKDESLSRTDVSVLDALADHIGEELGNDSGSERLRREGEALIVLLITSR